MTAVSEGWSASERGRELLWEEMERRLICVKSSYISSNEMVISIIIIEGAHELVRSWVPQQLLISK